MAAPWEQYQSAETGPWSAYAKQEIPVATQQPTSDGLSWEKLKEGVTGIAPSLLLGAAKPLYGLNQAAWQLAGKVVPSVANMGDWPVEMLNKRQAQLNAEAGPVVSKFTTEPAALIGENVPVLGAMNKITSSVGQIPSFARAMGANAVAGGALAYATPEKTGLTPDQFAEEKAKNVAINAALGTAPTMLAKGGELLGSLLRKEAGIATGAGEEAFKQAYKAGKQGNQEFVANMRGEAPMEDVLSAAKSNLNAIKQSRGQVYRSGMEDISKDKSILNFDAIDAKLKEAKDIGSYKGMTTNPNAIKALQEIKSSVNEWKAADAAEYHTPEGMDALKQRIGAILEDIPYGTKARTVAEGVYNSIKSTINEQAPKYAEVMKDYSQSSDLIKEIEKSLSLGNKASVATGLNKLQSLMRNNVNTNYGYRQELANKLMEAGGQDLMPALAGQALSSWTPRGLVGQGLDVSALLGTALTGGAHIPATAVTMATTSPRLMGEAAYKAGQIASKVPNMTEEQKNLARLLMIRAEQEGVK